MAKLTDKQEMFCLEYLKDLNKTQAAIRAGYSEKTAYSIGSENMSKPEIQDRIAELMEQRRNDVKIDANYVLSQAVKLHERCMQEVRPLRDRKGNHIKDDDGHPLYVFDSTGAKASLELIGKHIDVQAFKEKADVNLSVSPFEDMMREATASDDEE